MIREIKEPAGSDSSGKHGSMEGRGEIVVDSVDIWRLVDGERNRLTEVDPGHMIER